MKRIGLLIAACFGILSVPAWAADLPLKAPVAPVPLQTWTGFYAGLHAGWGWNSTDPVTASSSSPGTGLPAGAFFNPLTFNGNGNGPLGGAQIGANWQFAPTWLIGFEGDMSGTGIRQSQTLATSSSGFGGPPVAGIGTATMSENIDWLASVRGRFGYIWGPGLIYVTGGAAWARFRDNANATTSVVGPGCCAFPAAFNTMLTGWTIGGGYEALLNAHWLLRAEYLFYNFAGGVSGTVLPGTTTTPGTCNGFTCLATYAWGRSNVNVVRLGVGYKF
jgi:outer membrane immunogenic protein